MAKTIIVNATIENKEEKVKIGALSYLQSKAIRKMNNKMINHLPADLKQLQKKEVEEGLSPEDMERLIELQEKLEQESEPVQLEAIRLGLAKHDSSWVIPNLSDDSEISKQAHSELTTKAHEKIMDMFNQSELQTIYNFVTTGIIDTGAIESELSSIIDFTSR